MAPALPVPGAGARLAVSPAAGLARIVVACGLICAVPEYAVAPACAWSRLASLRLPGGPAKRPDRINVACGGVRLANIACWLRCCIVEPILCACVVLRLLPAWPARSRASRRPAVPGQPARQAVL